MRHLIFIVFAVLGTQGVISQGIVHKTVDSLYREDQFYISITYNLLTNKPTDLSQNGFSNGIHLGIIRDMPLNKNRNVAIGLGLGYATNSYYHNLNIGEDENQTITYQVITDNSTYSKNKFSNHILEVPLEIRWRTSTPEAYKFWRIYTGFKFGYMFRNIVKYKGDLGDFKATNLDDFNTFQYGLTLSFGYNTWNAHIYYALTPIFSKDAMLEGEVIDMNSVKIGLIFYIL